MSNLKKILKFEFYKAFKDKFIIISFFSLFILAIFLIIFMSYNFPLTKQNILTAAEKAEEIQEYEEKKQIFSEIIQYLDGESDSLPKNTILIENYDYEKEYDYYEFLLKTRTFESDYMGIFTLEHQNSYVMVAAVNVLKYLMPILAVFITYYILNTDINRGTIKNIIASPISRQNIFVGKMIFSYIVNIILYALAIAYPMLLGLNDLSAIMLIYNNVFYTQTVFVTVFIPHFITILFSILICVNITWLFTFIKKRSIVLFLPIIVIAILQFLFYLFNDLLTLDKNIVFHLFPLSYIREAEIFQIIEIFKNFTKGWLTLIITAILLIVFSVASIIFGKFKLKKFDL